MPVAVGLTAADSATTVVIVPTGVSQLDVPLDSFVPYTSQLDPDNWVLDRHSAGIMTVRLPPAVADQAYTFVLEGSSNAGISYWEKTSGTPAWVSISSTGILSGTPPATGIYTVNVRLHDNNGVIADASLRSGGFV